jgi:hypothetical protein
MLTRKQNELLYCQLAESFLNLRSARCHLCLVHVHNNNVSACRSMMRAESPVGARLETLLVDLVDKLWPLTLQATSNTTSVFSYETTANMYFQMCSLYACSAATMTRPVSDMVDSFVFESSGSQQQQLTIVRLKFLNYLLDDECMVETVVPLATRHRFETRVVNFIVHCYLNSSENPAAATSTLEPVRADTTSSESAFDKELVQLLHKSVAKLGVFQQAGIRFSSTIEHLLNAFVAKHAMMFKQTEVSIHLYITGVRECLRTLFNAFYSITNRDKQNMHPNPNLLSYLKKNA